MGRRKNKNHLSLPSLNQVPKCMFLKFLCQFKLPIFSFKFPHLLLYLGLYTSWIIKLNITISAGCPRNWKHDVKDRKMGRWQDLSAVAPVINIPEVMSAVKSVAATCSPMIHVKRCYPHASARNKRHEMGPYLCEPLLLLYTSEAEGQCSQGANLTPRWDAHTSDRTEVKE